MQDESDHPRYWIWYEDKVRRVKRRRLDEPLWAMSLIDRCSTLLIAPWIPSFFTRDSYQEVDRQAEAIQAV